MESSNKSDRDNNDFESSDNIFSPRPLTDLLAFLSPNDKIYDNVSESSSVSFVTHPFSEERSRNAKDENKHLPFSSVHDEIMKEIQTELEQTESVCSTCYSCSSCSTDTWEALGIDINKVDRFKPQQLPDELKKELQAKINAISIMIEKQEKQSAGGKKKIKLNTKKKIKTKKKYDAMSGLWNMLSTYDDFVITQPGYNAYQQEKPHWLDQEDIPWKQKEKARKKCVKWLEKYHKC